MKFLSIESSNPEILLKYARSILPDKKSKYYAADQVIHDLILAHETLTKERDSYKLIAQDEIKFLSSIKQFGFKFAWRNSETKRYLRLILSWGDWRFTKDFFRKDRI